MGFLQKIYSNRRILLNLISSDFKNRYLGNHLGIIWAFFQPIVMIAIYWFVFTHGFRSTPIKDVPFLLWLLVGLIPWFLVSDIINSASRSIIDQAFLVKKIVFEVKLLPLIKIGSALLVNIFFWALLLIFLIMYGFYPTLSWLQILYYLICLLSFSLGLALLLSSIIVFILDIGQIITIILQIFFWLTPVFWNKQILPEKYTWIVKLNPFAYFIEGLRDALLYNIPFWVHYKITIYFWVLTFVLIYIGNKTFNKLRPHFADVL